MSKFFKYFEFLWKRPDWEPDFQMGISGAFFVKNRDFNIPSELTEAEVSEYGVDLCTGGTWDVLQEVFSLEMFRVF